MKRKHPSAVEHAAAKAIIWAAWLIVIAAYGGSWWLLVHVLGNGNESHPTWMALPFSLSLIYVTGGTFILAVLLWCNVICPVFDWCCWAAKTPPAHDEDEFA